MARAKTYTCAGGAKHDFTLWVYAHWDTLIKHECSACGRDSHIIRGRVIHTAEKKKPPASPEDQPAAPTV